MADAADGLVQTAEGMFVLWNPSRFQNLVDYDSWEQELLEDSDIERHIVAGEVVPINIRADGAFGFEVRVGSEGPATLTDREARYLLAKSDPYRFKSEGIGRLSGIEDVMNAPGLPGLTVVIPSGSWSVTVHLLEWQGEAGAADDGGKPAASALPDFLLTVNGATDGANSRTSSKTFSQP